jgi:hypothetical protein
VDRGTAVAITAWKGGDNTINAAEAADGIVITVRRSRVQRPGQRRGGDGCCERHLYRDIRLRAGADGPLAVTVTSTMRRQHGHCDPTLTLTAALRWRSRAWKAAVSRLPTPPQRGGSSRCIRDHGYAEAGSTVTVNGVAAVVARMAPTRRPSRRALPTDDGPFAVNVATEDAAGNTATATQTLT